LLASVGMTDFFLLLSRPDSSSDLDSIEKRAAAAAL
jgi:hypothetical protein